jgi:hypothetical protein
MGNYPDRYRYRRTFSIQDAKAPLVPLKINKAQYHTWVYVNGRFEGHII